MDSKISIALENRSAAAARRGRSHLDLPASQSNRRNTCEGRGKGSRLSARGLWPDSNPFGVICPRVSCAKCFAQVQNNTDGYRVCSSLSVPGKLQHASKLPASCANGLPARFRGSHPWPRASSHIARRAQFHRANTGYQPQPKHALICGVDPRFQSE